MLMNWPIAQVFHGAHAAVLTVLKLPAGQLPHTALVVAVPAVLNVVPGGQMLYGTQVLLFSVEL